VGDIANQKISQQLSTIEGEREGIESSTPNGVLQTTVQGEQGEGETESSSPTPCPNSVEDDGETFKIGDRAVDFPTGFKGVVVGFRGESAGSLPPPPCQKSILSGFSFNLGNKFEGCLFP
jgi:hypothetical protein